MKPHHWFLPHAPDIVGILGRQVATTVAGLEALTAWASGATDGAERVRAAEHAADEAKRELREALSTAFTTPLAPEDLYQLSVGLDDILNGAKNLVREAEVMGTAPDAPIAEMAAELATGTGHVADALDALGRGESATATAKADEAVKSQRKLERTYRGAMSALLESGDVRELTSRRELYRRLSRTSDELVHLAERVWYAVLKAG